MHALARFRSLVAGGFLLSSLQVSVSAHAAPVGSEFRVNSYTPGTQWLTDVNTGANGEVLVAWNDPSRGGVIRRYDQAGNAAPAGEQAINRAPVALDGRGNFVALRSGPDGNGNGVYAAVYDRSGNLLVNEFRVNDTTLGEQIAPNLAVNAQGEFVVSWTSVVSGTYAIYLKRFRANGVAISQEALAGSPAARLQSSMAVAIDASGNSVVTWCSQGQPSLEVDVWLRRFNASGVAQGAPVRANTYIPGTQAGNTVAMNSTGEFIVVWESSQQASATYDIYAQRYSAAGVPVGGEFLVNTLLVGEQQLADVALADDRSFVIAWQSDNRWNDPSSLPTIYARQYRANGTATDIERPVSSSPTGRAFAPKLGLDNAGNYLIAWRQYDIVTADQDIYARRYVQDTLPAVVLLTNQQTVTPISGATGSFSYYRLDVPAGASSLQIDMTGPAGGDADLYLRFAGLPLSNVWDIRPYLFGSNESVVINNIPAGQWFIGINAYQSFSNVSLTATYR